MARGFFNSRSRPTGAKSPGMKAKANQKNRSGIQSDNRQRFMLQASNGSNKNPSLTKPIENWWKADEVSVENTITP